MDKETLLKKLLNKIVNSFGGSGNTNESADELHKYYKTLLESVKVDVLILDDKHTIIDTSKSFLNTLNVASSKIIGKKCHEIFFKRDNPCEYYGEKCSYCQVMDEGVTVKCTHKVNVGKDQESYLELEMIPIKNSSGKVIQVIQTITDITEKIATVKSLEKSNTNLIQFADNSDAAFFIVELANSSSTITYLSPAFEQIWEIKNQLIIDNPDKWSASIHPEDRERTVSIIRQFIEDKIPAASSEFRIVTASNKIKWIYAEIQIDNAASLKNKRVLGIARDITEKKLLELKLKEALDSATESINFKNYLLGNLNHEIRTPLNAVLGFSGILKDEYEDPDVIELADKIFRAGNRLLNTLDAIIDLSDLQSNRKRLLGSQINVYDILLSSKHKFEPLAAEKNLNLIIEEVDRGLEILSDEYLLSRVINNLLDNAIKFTQQGSVVISANINKGEVDNPELIIEIKDSGIGISKEKIDYIFDAFRQESEGNARKHQGAGLGLTIASKMVEGLGGSISVTSNLKQGSTFKIKLPMNENTLESAGKIELEMSKASAQSILERSILIVEDSEMNSEVLRHYLSDFINLNFASSFDQAIQMTQDNSFNLIITDIKLSDSQSGVSLMKELRTQEIYKNVPIIALTGYTLESDKNNFLVEGFSDYIAKPVNKEQLLEVIEQHLI